MARKKSAVTNYISNGQVSIINSMREGGVIDKRRRDFSKTNVFNLLMPDKSKRVNSAVVSALLRKGLIVGSKFIDWGAERFTLTKDGRECIMIRNKYYLLKEKYKKKT